MHLTGHERCTACGDDGFLIQEAPHEHPNGMCVEITVRDSYQGWMKIPHGGVSMALILELARTQSCSDSGPVREYPFRASFRWGGTPLFLGDSVRVSIERSEGKIQGSVRRIGEHTSSPYLTAELGDLKDLPEDLSSHILSFVEILGTDLKDKAVRLPRYRECFVCGMERRDPGLNCTFYRVENNGQSVIFSYHGLNPDDEEDFYWLRISDQEVHPGVIAAVLDEILGWSGFLFSREGGVTVKLEIDFMRPLVPGEKMVCCGRCTHMRGSSPRRLFWYSEGAVIPMRRGDHAPIAVARGQWLAMPALTEEMKANLLPRSSVEALFS